MLSISSYIYRAVAVILALGIHEMAHALVSYCFGDPTAKARGRLTLNPLAHIDWVGLAFLLFFGIGWAKPVPIDASYYKDRKGGIVWTSFAGPMANFLLSFICVVFYYLFYQFFWKMGTIGNVLLTILSYTATISASLGIFNLIPVPPLDGSKVLFAFLPDDIYYNAIQENMIWTCILMALIVTGLITTPVSYLSSSLINIFSTFCMKII